jgi:hypothetical protein
MAATQNCYFLRAAVLKHKEVNLQNCSLLSLWVKAWSVRLSEEHTASTWEEGAVDSIWPEKEGITGGWIRLQDKEFQNLYYTLYQILLRGWNQKIRGTGYMERWEVDIIFVRKPEGKRPVRRPSHRWEGFFKLKFKEEGSRCGLNSPHSLATSFWLR